MTDEPVFHRINELSAEEEALWRRAGDGGGLTAEDQQRLDEIGVLLDQCYDLLHQRQARRDVGLDPEDAALRPPDVVERYQQ